MADPFTLAGANTNGPSFGPIAITPDDDADLASPVRMLTIGEAGVISIVGWDGETYTSASLPAGSYPVFARRVRSTDTTATNITGWI